MMTKAEFDDLAIEFGEAIMDADYSMSNNRQMDAVYSAMARVMQVCKKSNDRFNAERFLDAVESRIVEYGSQRTLDAFIILRNEYHKE